MIASVALMLNIVDFDDCEYCLDPPHVWRLNVAAPSVNFFTWRGGGFKKQGLGGQSWAP